MFSENNKITNLDGIDSIKEVGGSFCCDDCIPERYGLSEKGFELTLDKLKASELYVKELIAKKSGKLLHTTTTNDAHEKMKINPKNYNIGR